MSDISELLKAIVTLLWPLGVRLKMRTQSAIVGFGEKQRSRLGISGKENEGVILCLGRKARSQSLLFLIDSKNVRSPSDGTICSMV